MKSSVCIEMIFSEYPFVERIARAAQLGCAAVEFWAWEDKDLDAVAAAARAAGVAVAAFSANRRSSLTDPRQRDDLLDEVSTSLQVARRLGTKHLLLLTDALGPGGAVVDPLPQLSDDRRRSSVVAGLRALAPLAEAAGVTLVLEPLNTHVDHAGYWLASWRLGFDLVREAASPAVKLLFDIYHMQIMEGNIIAGLTQNVDELGYVHVADVPGRQEPGSGELNYRNIFRALDRAGYRGYVGFEYAPSGASEDTLAASLALLQS